jgi:hypothetical protein
MLSCCLATLATPVLAQPSNATAELQKSFTDVSGWVTRAADLVPADKYSYRPNASVRTFGEQVAHVADAYNWYCTNATGRTVEWTDAIEKGNTDKATVTRKLGEALATCAPVYAGNGRLSDLIGNIAHTNLHYGNMITYMRMLGLTPPSS